MKKNMWSDFATNYLQSISRSKGKHIRSKKTWQMVANFINQNNSCLNTGVGSLAIEASNRQNEALDKKRGQKSGGVRSGTNSKQLGHTSDVFWHPDYHHHPSSSEFPTKNEPWKNMSKLTCSISLSFRCVYIYIYLTFINPHRIRHSMPASIVRKSSLYQTPSPPSPVPLSHHHRQSSASDVIFDINFRYINISRTYLSSSSSSPELEEHFQVLTYTFSSYASTMYYR